MPTKIDITLKVTCCARQIIFISDFWRGELHTDPVVNRMCCRCRTHWYGTPDAVKQYTREQWEAWLASPDIGESTLPEGGVPVKTEV